MRPEWRPQRLEFTPDSLAQSMVALNYSRVMLRQVESGLTRLERLAKELRCGMPACRP